MSLNVWTLSHQIACLQHPTFKNIEQVCPPMSLMSIVPQRKSGSHCLTTLIIHYFNLEEILKPSRFFPCFLTWYIYINVGIEDEKSVPFPFINVFGLFFIMTMKIKIHYYGNQILLSLGFWFFSYIWDYNSLSFSSNIRSCLVDRIWHEIICLVGRIHHEIICLVGWIHHEIICLIGDEIW